MRGGNMRNFVRNCSELDSLLLRDCCRGSTGVGNRVREFAGQMRFTVSGEDDEFGDAEKNQSKDQSY